MVCEFAIMITVTSNTELVVFFNSQLDLRPFQNKFYIDPVKQVGINFRTGPVTGPICRSAVPARGSITEPIRNFLINDNFIINVTDTNRV